MPRGSKLTADHGRWWRNTHQRLPSCSEGSADDIQAHGGLRGYVEVDADIALFVVAIGACSLLRTVHEKRCAEKKREFPWELPEVRGQVVFRMNCCACRRDELSLSPAPAPANLFRTEACTPHTTTSHAPTYQRVLYMQSYAEPMSTGSW